MGKPYHVDSVTAHSEETEVTAALYGRLAKVATAPNATGTTRKKITVNDRRKTAIILANLR